MELQFGPRAWRRRNSLSGQILTLLAMFFLGSFRAEAIEISPLVGDAHGSDRTTLVVILHGGTANDGPADWSLTMARRLADRPGNATYVGLLRPGFRDSNGRRSPGKRPDKDRHQYSRENNDVVAETIERLIEQVEPRNVILVGYSGGAAMAGAIAGRYPDLADAIILVGCPCTRSSVYGNRNQVPMDHVATLAPSTRIIAITGEQDDRTSPDYAREYIAEAKKRGLKARFIEVSGGGHRFRDSFREFMSALQSELHRK